MIKAAIILQLACSCAPNVAPDTIFEIVKNESGYNEFAINVNAPKGKFYFRQPNDLMTAIEITNRALSRGYSVDIGLMQVNSQHLSRFGVSVIESFDPCTNIRMGGRILTEFYAQALKKRNQYSALIAALSAYNTGNFYDGLKNGYVEQYFDKPTKNIGDFMSNQSDTTVDLSTIKEELEKIDDTDRIFQEAELHGVPVRQDMADDLGFFEEKAVSEEDAEDALLDNDNNAEE